MTYIDAYLIPLANPKLGEYESFSRKVASIYREYGALRVVDCRLDEEVANDAGFHADNARDTLESATPTLRDFTAAADAFEGETVILSWTEWPSKQARDVGLAKALADPRLQPRDGEEAIFEGRRLIAGAFVKLIDA
jgi:uncharacterized protein YbaA (DUF1428 family)